jgi:hypothetical protein
MAEVHFDRALADAEGAGDLLVRFSVGIGHSPQDFSRPADTVNSAKILLHTLRSSTGRGFSKPE